MPVRFSQIDDSNRADHTHLRPGDVCYYLFEYTPRAGFAHSATNSLILNIKKSPLKRQQPEWAYKVRDMRLCSRLLAGALLHEWLKVGTIVPMPPSKAKSHPEYDSRMLTICRELPVPFRVDVRELIVQADTMRTAHENEFNRPTIDELARNLRIQESETEPAPTSLLIVDDVLTAGSHFKAAQRVLMSRFPGVPIAGAFIARRLLPPTPAP